MSSTVVAGVDFGTLSVRVSIFDSRARPSGIGRRRIRTAPHAVTIRTTRRKATDEHMSALALCYRAALDAAKVDGSVVQAMALDTTGSSVIPVGENLAAARRILFLVRPSRLAGSGGDNGKSARGRTAEAIEWCGGVYSSEWGFSKLLHWLRHNPDKRDKFVSAFEHCDYVATVLCGIQDLDKAPRSVCAMGHKWMWNEALGGLPSDEFLTSVDPLLRGVRAKIRGRYLTSDHIAGKLSPEWAARLRLNATMC